MSSCDGWTLEYFVEDSFMNITSNQEERIVNLLEPEREWVEYRLLDDFDEETMSWRGYRNGMWCALEKYDNQIEKIIG